MGKNSFVLYTDYYEHVDSLTDEEAGELFKGIFRYAMGNESGINSRVVNMAFSFIKAQMDKDTEKYNETCRKRSESGAKGGRPKANGFDEEAKKANGFSEKQTKAKKADNENDNDNDFLLIDKGKNRKRFVPPTKAEIEAYCQETGRKLDADRFIDFYSSKNWYVGKNKMTDWKAAVRNWTRQDVRGCQSSSKIHDYDEREYTEDDYRDLIGI